MGNYRDTSKPTVKCSLKMKVYKHYCNDKITDVQNTVTMVTGKRCYTLALNKINSFLSINIKT